MTPPSNPIRDILRKVVVYTGVIAVVIAVVGGLAGYAAAGMDGLYSALTGTAVAVVFAAITAVSIMIAAKYPPTLFFGIVLGAWLLKIVIFMGVLAVVTNLDFVVPMVLFLSMVAAIVGTLTVDVIVVMTSRLSYTDASALPTTDPDEPSSTGAEGNQPRPPGSIT